MDSPPQEREAPFDDPVQVVTRRGRRQLDTLRGRNPERLIFFSDAVFAIALTLLVLDIRLPAVEGGEGLNQALAAVWPKFGAYLISFAVISGAWLSHFRRFRVTIGYDPRLIQLNFLLLFLVGLMPFPTAVFAEHAPQAAATLLYGGNLGLIFAVQTLCWWYSRRAGLLDPIVDDELYGRTFWPLFTIAALFLGSLPFLLINPMLTLAIWCIAGPVVTLGRFLPSRGR